MPHQEARFWTFTALVGAFLDLSIAFLLLCASSLAYLVSAFLGLFGLSLPSPRNGFFGGQSERFSSVRSSVRSKYPFSSSGAGQSEEKLVKEKNIDKVNGKGEDEASCSISGRGSQNVVKGEEGLRNDKGVGFGEVSSHGIKEGKSPIKGKGSWRLRHGLKHKRKGAVDRGSVSSASSHDPQLFNPKTTPSYPSGATRKGSDINEIGSIPAKSEDENRVSRVTSQKQRASPGCEMDVTDCENKAPERAASPVKEVKNTSLRDLTVDGTTQNTIRILEQALEEERSARDALFIELEEERSAAASAADGAMAMIYHLREDKASIEMESRQYQRMIEEKFAFDAEEMKILKEILLRREREKYFLEKEVETYSKMFIEHDQMEPDMKYTETTLEQEDSSIYPIDGRVMMPQQISDSMYEGEKKYKKNKLVASRTLSVESENNTLANGKEVSFPAISGVSYSLDNCSPCKGLTSNTIQTSVETPIIVRGDDNMEDDRRDLLGSQIDTESHVHAIDVNMDTQSDVNKTEVMPVKVNIPRARESPTLGRLEYKPDNTSPSLDMTIGLPPTCPKGKTVQSNLRRNSMSAFDNERSKIDNEVGWLRERLRAVQKGKEKINFSMAHREREKNQFQILEGITSQLRGIQQLTEPGKAVRQASLPHSFSKVNNMSKKRCWRSSSIE